MMDHFFNVITNYLFHKTRQKKRCFRRHHHKLQTSEQDGIQLKKRQEKKGQQTNILKSKGS